MTDFMSSLPVLQSHPQLKRNLFQAILTVIAITLCLLKDPSILVTISSFGLLALVISYILLFIYGVGHFQFSFETKYLYPLSTADFLSKIGVYIYSLGFILLLLSQMVCIEGYGEYYLQLPWNYCQIDDDDDDDDDCRNLWKSQVVLIWPEQFLCLWWLWLYFTVLLEWSSSFSLQPVLVSIMFL